MLKTHGDDPAGRRIEGMAMNESSPAAPTTLTRRALFAAAAGIAIAVTGCGAEAPGLTQSSSAPTATAAPPVVPNTAAPPTPAPTQPPPPVTIKAEGRWSGTVGSANTINALVLDDNSFWAVVGTNAAPTAVLTGNGTLSASTYSIGELRQVTASGTSSTGSLMAMVSTQSALTGSVTLGSTTAALSANYSSVYAGSPSVAAAVGVFAGTSTEAGRGGLASLVVEPNGGVKGLTQQGCAFTGTLAPRRSGNVFDLTLTTTVEPDGSCSSSAPRSGVLQIGSNGQALLATATADRSDALGVIANRTTTATGRLGDFPFGLSATTCDNGSAEKA